MAAPNIVNVTTITGKSAAMEVTTTATDLVTNDSDSGKVIKLNALYIANIDGSAAAGITTSIMKAGSNNRTQHYLTYTVSVPADSTLDIITKPFMYSRFIRLQSVAINLKSYSGSRAHFFAKNILIENEADFHRAQLSLSLNIDDVPANLIIEAQGNPSDLDSLYAEGYLKFDELNVSTPMLDFAKSLMPELFSEVSVSELVATGEIWMDFH